MATNLKSAFNMVKAFQRVLMKSPAGRIINMSSVVGLTGNMGQANYAASKAGLIGFTKSLAQEFASRKVTSNAIAPGLIVGARNKQAMADDLLEDQMNEDCYPVGRYGAPEDIANVALFLASDEAAFVTGIVMVADGGLTLQSPEALVRPSFRRRWRDTLLVPQSIEEAESQTRLPKAI